MIAFLMLVSIAERNFDESSISAWKAALTVAKTQSYRIVTVSKEE